MITYTSSWNPTHYIHVKYVKLKLFKNTAEYIPVVREGVMGGIVLSDGNSVMGRIMAIHTTMIKLHKDFLAVMKLMIW